MIRLLLAMLAAALLALGYSLWWAERADKRADVAEAELAFATAANDALVETLEIERAAAAKMAEVADTYEKEKADALDRESRLRADLAAGDRRLRHEIGALYTAQLSEAAAHSIELDAAAQRGAELVAAAVAVGAACDARDRAWRAVAEADRQ